MTSPLFVLSFDTSLFFDTGARGVLNTPFTLSDGLDRVIKLKIDAYFWY